jgi:hypothetical protein
LAAWVLHGAKDLEGVMLVGEAAAKALGDRGGDVSLTPAEQVELELTIGERALVVAADRVTDHLDDLAGEQALDDGLDRLPRHEGDRLARVQIGELVAVVGEDALGHEHHQHRVVTLKGGEHIGVGLERGEAVDTHVAGSAAALAGGLDRGGRVPGRGRLHAGGEGLELAALALGRVV